MEGGRQLFLYHYTTHLGACRIFPILRELWDRVTTLSRKGYIASWANDCDGALDNVSVVSESNCELRDSNGGLVN